MKVICVCGVGCSGKSTYCDKLGAKILEESGIRPVILQPGIFFRSTLGPDFFEVLDNPTAPVVTENWVRNMVWQATNLAYNYKRDLIIDGFPRTLEQFYWLMDSSFVSSYRLPVEMHFLWVSEGVLADRIMARKMAEPEQVELIDKRMTKDASLLSRLHTAVTRDDVSADYFNLIIKEIEYDRNIRSSIR